MAAPQSDTQSLLKSHNPFSSYLEIAEHPVMYSPVSRNVSLLLVSLPVLLFSIQSSR